MQEPRQQPDLARSPLLFRPQKRPHAGQRDHPAESIRIHGEAVKDRRRRERDRGPAKPGGRGTSRRQPRQMPRERTAARRDHEEKHHDTAVSTQRKRRRDDRGKSRGMNGVDLAVEAAADVVGRERTRVVRLIVASPVVVLDLQIAIEQQALRDDEIVRLIATGDRRSDLPRGKGKHAEGKRSRREPGSLANPRGDAWQKAFRSRKAGRGNDHDQQDGGPDHPRDRSGPDQERRWSGPRQPRQDDERQQPDRDKRGASSREPDDDCGRQNGGRDGDRRNRQ